jgi:NADPH2:quinone reductase
MHAWLCEQTSGVQDLVWKQVPTPQPNPDEVLIEIEAASLNFPDLLIVQNKYQLKPPLPFVPGSEYSGIITQIGSNVQHLQVGMRVACLTGTGGFATHTTAPAKLCLPLDPKFTPEQGASFIMTYATSHHALIDRGALQPTDTVLILGAAGGVGSAAIQIAKAVGARVIAAASSAEKCAVCKALGADDTIDYSQPNFREQIKALTAGLGPNVIYDPVGGELAEPAFRSIAWRGRYLVVGFAAGSIPNLPLNLTLLKGASIVGVFWGDFSRREYDKNRAMLAELSQWFVQGKITPLIHSVFDMSELKDAYAKMSSRGVLGKLVLKNKSSH